MRAAPNTLGAAQHIGCQPLEQGSEARAEAPQCVTTFCTFTRGSSFGGLPRPFRLRFPLLTVSGRIQRRQLAAIEYLRAENQVLRE